MSVRVAPRLLPVMLVGLFRSLHAADDCAECHAEIVRKQQSSPHANALRPFEGSRLAASFSEFRIAERNGYQFEYSAGTVTAHRGQDSAAATLEWAFGLGVYAMTAVGRLNGEFFEHRMSYYSEPARHGITPGHAPGASRSARSALGQFQSPDKAFRCFNCHSTGLQKTSDGGPDLSTINPGIHCARCHGPAETHILAARRKRPGPEIRKAIFNSGRLPARASVEVCGACHRAPKPGQSSAEPEFDDPLSVRFQPVGLMASRCFQKSGKLSCLTCHDPHANSVLQEPSFYIEKCLGCHSASTARIIQCRRAERQDCQPCHMPRAAPAPFLTFTDHRIRRGSQ